MAGGASGSGRLADPRAVLGRGTSGLRHAEGAARRRPTARTEEHRVARPDAKGHARRRLPALDERLSGRRVTIAGVLVVNCTETICRTGCRCAWRRVLHTAPAAVAGNAAA